MNEKTKAGAPNERPAKELVQRNITKPSCALQAEEYKFTLPINILDNKCPVPAFPLDFLPEPFRTFVSDIAERTQAPPEFAAIPLIVGTGAVIGNAAVLQPKERDTAWRESPALWGCVIAPSGSCKTPPATQALKPVVSLQQELLRQWEEDTEAYETELRKWEKGSKDGEPPEKPLRPTVILNEATQEGLALAMQENPRGIFLYRDEIAGLFNSFDKYRAGKGDDRQFFLEAYSGGTYSSQRKREGSLFVSRMFLSIYGTIQPEVAKKHFSGVQDGMAQRFGLLAWPEPRPFNYVDKAPDSTAANDVAQAIEAMHQVAADCAEPFVFTFNAEARTEFADFSATLRNRRIDASALRSHLSKYEGLFIRLSLVHWFMRLFCQRPRTMGLNSPASRVVDADTARAVRLLIEEYLKAHAHHIYGYLDSHTGAEGAIPIARWIVDRGFTEFKYRDIAQRQLPGLKCRHDLLPALEYLADIAGWVIPEEIPPTKKGGRPGMKYLVNPAVLRGQFV